MGAKKSIFETDLTKTHRNKDEIEFRKRQEEFMNGVLDNYEIPDFIKDDSIAVEKFKFLSDELEKKKILSNVDNVALGQYCKLYSEYCKCVEAIKTYGLWIEYTNQGGKTNVVESPYLKTKRQCETQMIQLSKQFGFTPKDRLGLTPTKPQEKEKDEIEEEFGDI